MELYLSLGTNLGNRLKNLENAIEAIEVQFKTSVRRRASIYQSLAQGFDGGPFLNTVIVLDVPDKADLHDILSKCKEIETSMGRLDTPRFDNNGQRIYHDRIIDIDILFAGNRTLDDPDLVIPHKNIRDRSFVMFPLGEVISKDIKTQFAQIFD